MKKLSLILLLFATAAYGEIYTWTDSRGTSHYVSNQYDIPQRYLSRAKIYDLATGKKLPLSAAPAPQAPGTAAQPAPAASPTPQQAPQIQPQLSQPAAAPVIQQAPAPQRQPQVRTRARQGLPPDDE